MSKKMRMDFLAAKEESGIILSAEMFSNIDFTKMEETKKRYEEFLELAIELDISHILVPVFTKYQRQRTFQKSFLSLNGYGEYSTRN